MKKLIFLFLLALSISTFSACGGKYEIALVTDVGNIDDKSFNEGAWNGVKQFAEERRVRFNYYRPNEDSNSSRIEQIENAIDKGAKMVVCPGYLLETAVYDVQDKYPKVAFLLLDGEPHSADYSVYKTSANVHNILYKEEQAGYLAGYAAVKDGYRQLGFIGGKNVPAVIRYGYGYVQGAEAAAEELGLTTGDVTIKYNYAGTFAPSDEIKSKMDGWYGTGTEIVFSCGGAIYVSVTASATEKGKKVCVDSDQSNISDTIVTSALKDLTVSVKLALTAFYDNNLKWDANRSGKTAVLGVAENAVGLPTATTSWRFRTFTVDEYTAVFNKLKDGTITVSNDITARPTSPIVTVDWTA
jgi:basic membrane protein A